MNKNKYRAWWISGQKMLIWDEDCDAIKDAIPLDSGDEWTEDCIVMQFSGRCDKNNIEIYESDIVRVIVDGGIIEGEVSFESPSFVLGKSPFSTILNYDSKDMEVIGNAFETEKYV